jgi:mono/diheme cytochrome c family protein
MIFYDAGFVQEKMKILVKGLALLVALLMCGYAALSSHARPQETQKREESETTSDERLAHAKTVFQERCARCHGADGRGKTVVGGMLGVPDFTDTKWWKEDKSDERLITSVTEGKGEMPAFGKKLTKQEIGALVSYVRRFGKARH